MLGAKYLSNPPPGVGHRSRRWPKSITGKAAGHDCSASNASDLTLYWRHLLAHQYDEDRTTAVRDFVRHAAPLSSPQRRRAANGDAEAATGVALALMEQNFPQPAFDVAMTVVLAYALEDDIEAATVVANAVRRMPGEANCARIATSWLARNIENACRRAAAQNRSISSFTSISGVVSDLIRR
jgi:hypothetical protein